MKIIPVTDPAFAPYGRVVEGYPVAGLLKALEEKTPCPEGTVYFPKVDALHEAENAAEIGDCLFAQLSDHDLIDHRKGGLQTGLERDRHGDTEYLRE